MVDIINTPLGKKYIQDSVIDKDFTVAHDILLTTNSESEFLSYLLMIKYPTLTFISLARADIPNFLFLSWLYKYIKVMKKYRYIISYDFKSLYLQDYGTKLHHHRCRLWRYRYLIRKAVSCVLTPLQMIVINIVAKGFTGVDHMKSEFTMICAYSRKFYSLPIFEREQVYALSQYVYPASSSVVDIGFQVQFAYHYTLFHWYCS